MTALPHGSLTSAWRHGESLAVVGATVQRLDASGLPIPEVSVRLTCQFVDHDEQYRYDGEFVAVTVERWSDQSEPDKDLEQFVKQACRQRPDAVAYSRLGDDSPVGATPLAMCWPETEATGFEASARAGQVLVGYSWVTVVPAHLAKRIAPQRRAHAMAHLFEVEELDGGALYLRATKDPADFRGEALRSMFLSLVDILPAGRPAPSWKSTWGIFAPEEYIPLVMKDPRDYR